MKVEGPDFGREVASRQKDDLKSLVGDLLDTRIRVCPGCNLPCSCSGSVTCACGCAPNCEHSPQFMTSDPEFPIEPGIAALTYAFHQLRQCPPCWSCEGHMGPGNEIQRVPAVWFYARSQVFAGMIGDYVAGLWAKRKISMPWRVSVTFANPDAVGPAYSLQPDTGADKVSPLELMQRDADIIAEGLCDGIQARARSLMQRIDRFLDNR